MAKDLAVQGSYGKSSPALNEFAATMDLVLDGNTFASDGDAGVGLDFGTGFFQFRENNVPSSFHIGLYLLDGVHDGTTFDNSIGFVNGSAELGDAIGVVVRGTQRVVINNNYLAGGYGANSVGVSIGPAYGLDVPIPSTANQISPNNFGPQWGVDYDPTNAP